MNTSWTPRIKTFIVNQHEPHITDHEVNAFILEVKEIHGNDPSVLAGGSFITVLFTQPMPINREPPQRVKFDTSNLGHG